LLTVLLVTTALGLYGVISLRSRRVELTADLERQTRLFGSSLRVALEAAIQDGLYEDVRDLIQRMQGAERSIEVVYQDLLHPDDSAAFGRVVPGPAPAQQAAARGADPSSGAGPPSGSFIGPPSSAAPGPVTPAAAPAADEKTYPQPPSDPTREARLRRIEITGQPYGEHIELDGHPVYAYMFPIRGSQHRTVAVVDLIRDHRDLEVAMSRATREVLLTLGGLALVLALLVGLTVRQEFSGPLLRLVGGIDEVSRGDYTGAILRERADEVGTLADRFNEMTRSLRAAREQILAGVDAKLQLEARLRHSDKLATIGQLAAGIAHEVGTPLNVIGGRARVMARRADDPSAVEKNAEIIATQAERITKIIQQLLDYARRKVPARSPVDLRRVCASTLDFLEHQLQTRHVVATLHPFATLERGRPDGSGVGTEPDGPPGEALCPPPRQPVVMGDSDQLQQVLLNLCINAIQAMPEGGQLDLSLEGLVRKKPGLDRAPAGGYVMLAIADTGVGIAEEHLDRIFEPFYSTKSVEGRSDDGPGGSGLGLSVSTGIIKDHDGWIEIERQRPRGTVFRVFLPAPEPDELPRVEPSPPHKPAESTADPRSLSMVSEPA
jgi:signal transduction histidine kinase